MLRARPLAMALASIVLPLSAAAQTPPAELPAPAAPPTAPPPVATPTPPGNPVYPPGTAPPGYPPPGYAQPTYPGYPVYPPGYGYVPPPPPPPPPKDLRWSLRFDPFDLLLRRLTFQAEVAVVGPLALEVAPSWIFGTPYSGIDEKGFTIAGHAVFYLSGKPFRGLWIKAHVAYETFTAVYTNPFNSNYASDPTRASSAILGALFGDTFIVPRNGGFALSGGIGVAVATAPKLDLVTARNTPIESHATLYDGFDRVRLLGTMSLGVGF